MLEALPWSVVTFYPRSDLLRLGSPLQQEFQDVSVQPPYAMGAGY